jgi:hypothetical protein
MEQIMTSKTMNPPKTRAAKAAVQPEINGAVNEKSEENIRLLAYRKWEAAGRPAGDGLCFWFEAERELCQA